MGVVCVVGISVVYDMYVCLCMICDMLLFSINTLLISQRMLHTWYKLVVVEAKKQR